MLENFKKEKSLMFPGQGSQFRGMGKDLFPKYPELLALADSILGYSVQDICQNDPEGKLSFTLYTQPCLFVVNALYYLEYKKNQTSPVHYLLGHSLGEYNALLAAGVFDFKTGLEIVKRRAELFAELNDGGMLAVMGSKQEDLELMINRQFSGIDIANYNSDDQTILSGNPTHLKKLEVELAVAGMKTVMLNVSGAFHSRYMVPAQEKFALFIKKYNFNEPTMVVYSNYRCTPYTKENTGELLTMQIANPVSWKQQIKLLIDHGVDEFKEVGPGTILTRLVEKIKMDRVLPNNMKRPSVENPRLGALTFTERYNLKEAYVAGAMYKGIASTEMVIRMGRADLLSFLGCGGMTIGEVGKAIEKIQSSLSSGKPFGINFLHNPTNPQWEMNLAKLCIEKNIRVIEASAFATATAALVYFRLKGAKRSGNGDTVVGRHIIAKLSRPEVAEMYLNPAPENIVRDLVQKGLLTVEEGEAGAFVPLASDITTEADSGGHTDQGVAFTLVPTISLLRDRVVQKFRYRDKIHIGAAGGIGTPHAVAAAFMLRADYVMTGSVNQCTVEAGTSDLAKDLLAQMNIQDTAYAPAGDMFELGAKVQVLKKGVLFPVRANKLYELYRQYDSLDDLPEEIGKMLQEKYFKKSIEQVWEEVCTFMDTFKPEQLDKIRNNPKMKMANIFKYYFAQSTKYALVGDTANKVDFQIQCGPALGAFNQWVKGTPLEDWRNRHVDEIGLKLMFEAEQIYANAFAKYESKKAEKRVLEYSDSAL